MLEMLFQTSSPMLGHKIKVKNFLYRIGEILTFCHVIYKFVENLQKKPFEYG